VNVETKEQSKQSMNIHLLNKSKKFKRYVVCQKADGYCFLGQERSADDGSHATKEVYCETKKQRRTIENKRRGMLTYGVMLLHDNASAHASRAARTGALLEYFIWGP
jgi:hypothetical protein